MRGGQEASALFGRDVEFAALRDSVARSARGDGHAVVVEGEAGIGKSTLVAAAVHAAAADGFTVLVGRADEMTRALPFAPVIAALRADGGDAASSLASRQHLVTAARSVLSPASGEQRQAAA